MPVLGQPRFSKRISMIQSEGFPVKAVAFERDYHKGRIPDCQITMLGSIDKGQYLKRLVVLAKAIPALRRHTGQTDAIYAFGLDLAILVLITNIFRKVPVIFEAGDIRPIQVSAGLKGKFMKYLSQKTFNLCKLLVVTSEEFVTGYYADGNASGAAWLVLENKMDVSVVLTNSDRSMTGTQQSGVNSFLAETSIATSWKPDPNTEYSHSLNVMKIGYFGLLRSPWSFNTLATYARDNPDSVKIIVAGALDEKYEEFERLTDLTNVEYLGPYSSPDDLPQLYQQVDLVWGCYPEPAKADSSNNEPWLWAQAVCRSNRFYESCFYKVPIVSMADSSDGRAVKRWNIGPTLNTYDYTETQRQLRAITPKNIATWCDNMQKMPASVYQYTTESAELAAAVRSLIRS